MTENPLEQTREQQSAIEALARRLWEEAGRAGAVAQYREQADELHRMEAAGRTGQLPNPLVKAPIVAEEAAIQENLGEFPSAYGLTDQGDARPTPMTRKEQRQEGADANPVAEAATGH